MIIWFTGPPDAGKTTTIKHLVDLLYEGGINFVVYDGDPITDTEYDLVVVASISDLQLEGIVVHVDTPRYICAYRNTRGYYTQGSAPASYVPDNPDIVLCTICGTAEENARKVYEHYENSRI